MHNDFMTDWRPQDICQYDAESKSCQPPKTPQSGASGSGLSDISRDINGSDALLYQTTTSDTEIPNQLQDKIRDFGYSSHGNYNSMSLLRTAELHGGQPTMSSSSSPRTSTNNLNIGSDSNRKFKEAVRQLPPQTCIDRLINTFFVEINWQYDLLDEESFRKQLVLWKETSYSDLQAGFERLALETIVFPALLFQVLAHALLFHPPHDEAISPLMTMADMTFVDLGIEYSDRSAELLELIGKRGITIATVQAGLLRASFLKSSGQVIEAWHALGAAIRDAQEIGLHTGRIVADQPPKGSTPRRENFSLVGHKVWVVLHIWDLHMAVVLGRPIATDIQIDEYARTIQDETKRQDLFSHWKTEIDPPRPFDIIMAGYNVAYRYFKDIHQIEANGAKPEDYTTVENIHTAIQANMKLLPSWCLLINPNTTFDQLPGCQWLPMARDGLWSLINLVILALHRPFIFSFVNSRTEALKAAKSILMAQERLFARTEPRHRKVFNPVYASFDSIVLIAAICLVSPILDDGQLLECTKCVEKGMQRLGNISQSNSMAASAYGVVCSLYHTLMHRLGTIPIAEDDGEPLPDLGPMSLPIKGDLDITSHGQLAELPFDTLLPPRPTHDLFFDHVSIPQMPVANALDQFPSHLDAPTVNMLDGWNFEGDFSDSSFWNLMNELNKSN
ncbi:transcriptional regulator family: Fungal Specific TF [Penicillium hetheringtonii]|uniref:Transcriptional regulator family: Fungal Specific TF n=1 Tax=Penicillium hetheringtonii TaxID=911720 RepID=A0AAD6DWZ6_9EURO|nr:transcriptional regulator family: Fungal Specific TF [Penicillium hetheringtonii]